MTYRRTDLASAEGFPWARRPSTLELEAHARRARCWSCCAAELKQPDLERRGLARSGRGTCSSCHGGRRLLFRLGREPSPPC